MNILHLNCSARGPDSESTVLAQGIVARLLEKHPQARVVKRELGSEGPANVDAAYAAALAGLPAVAGGSLDLSDQLIAELEQADYLVIGTPMHNFTLPAALKAWIDHVVRIHRTFQVTPDGKVGSLADRPVLVAVASGGWYCGERARQPDFLTPYLRAILATIGLRDLHFFSVQGTVFGAEALAAAHLAAQRELDVYFAAAATVA